DLVASPLVAAIVVDQRRLTGTDDDRHIERRSVRFDGREPHAIAAGPVEVEVDGEAVRKCLGQDEIERARWTASKRRSPVVILEVEPLARSLQVLERTRLLVDGGEILEEDHLGAWNEVVLRPGVALRAGLWRITRACSRR